MKEQIKELRVKIDGLAQLTSVLQCNKEPFDITWQSQQVLKAIDSLYLAKAWLGKVLGELGEENPYPKDGTRKTVDDIEPTADKATERNVTEDGRVYEQRTHIEKVNWLRQEIKNTVKALPDCQEYVDKIIAEMTFAYKHLTEARFWLGFELERIKSEVV
jgi:hypothetical protein